MMERNGIIREEQRRRPGGLIIARDPRSRNGEEEEDPKCRGEMMARKKGNR
jgi:hypothetical protein